MNSNKILQIEKLTKDYYSQSGYKIRLFENLGFEIAQNEFTAIFAPEGAGKSSLLKILTGIDKEYSGTVKDNAGRGLLLIPDKPDSFQWLSVEDNIKYFAKDISEEKLSKIIKDVGLEGYEKHFPHPKSTGFRFRISLARALVLNPTAILIDDSLKNINDDKTRIEILDLLRNLNFIYDEVTFIIALTNLTEATFLGDKILFLSKHPAHLIADVSNSLSADRKTEIVRKPEFISKVEEYKNMILNFDENLLIKITV